MDKPFMCSGRFQAIIESNNLERLWMIGVPTTLLPVYVPIPAYRKLDGDSV